MKTYHLSNTDGPWKAIEKMLQQAGTQPTAALGLDLELRGAAGALIVGGGAALDMGKHGREHWVDLVRWLGLKGCAVHVVQEACGFGWQFHRDLLAAGGRSLVVAPEALSGRRKTDKRDARQLATLLWDRAARGNHQSLRVVKMPAEQQQRRRSEGRHRAQLVAFRNRLEAHGRAMMWDHGWLEVPEGWWGKRKWPKLREQLGGAAQDWLIAMLAPLQQSIVQIVARIREMDVIIAAHGAQMGLEGAAPKGLGGHTRMRLAAEAIDWKRFENRRQVGSFIGCCPAEKSSGGRQRLGSIDRMGNRRMRTLLVEAVWRLWMWNKGWRGFTKFPHVFGAGARVGGATRKKAVVACARLLAVDLWRIETGRIQLADVGLVPADDSEHGATRSTSTREDAMNLPS